jgi:hypothetical protein
LSERAGGHETRSASPPPLPTTIIISVNPAPRVNSINTQPRHLIPIAINIRHRPNQTRMHSTKPADYHRQDLTDEGREDQLYALYLEARRLVEDLSRSTNGDIQLAVPTAAVAAGEQLDSAAASCGPDQQKHPQQLMLATGSLLSSALFEVSVQAAGAAVNRRPIETGLARAEAGPGSSWRRDPRRRPARPPRARRNSASRELKSRARLHSRPRWLDGDNHYCRAPI